MFADQFDRVESSDENDLKTRYDFDSSMHYRSTSSSISDDKPVMLRKFGPDNLKDKFSNRYGLSELDALEVNTLYNCRVSAPGSH